MRFGRKIDDGVHRMISQQPRHQFTIANAPVDEDVKIRRPGNRPQIARVGQGVEVDDFYVAGCNRVTNKTTTDESGSTSDQVGLHDFGKDERYQAPSGRAVARSPRGSSLPMFGQGIRESGSGEDQP